MDDMTFPGRRLTFPIVLDDQWSREALTRYMNSIRDTAVYLPSNVDYLARNNGFDTAEEVLAKLVASDWVSSRHHLFAGSCAMSTACLWGWVLSCMPISRPGESVSPICIESSPENCADRS